MPRFYLHVCDGKLFAEDEEGVELHDIEAARRQAIVGLRDIMSAEMKDGQINMAAFVEIEDENHQLVMTVPFLDAVEVLTRHYRRPRNSCGLASYIFAIKFPPPADKAGRKERLASCPVMGSGKKLH